jgi:hypothetical protein
MLVCPFCGLATELPHETQAICIEALQTEISRVREVVDRFKAAAGPATPAKPRASGTPPTPKDHTR